jgi:hypothetical protein
MNAKIYKGGSCSKDLCQLNLKALLPTFYSKLLLSSKFTPVKSV